MTFDRDEVAALEELVNRLVDQRMATVDRMAEVAAVNTDGTVTLDLGQGATAPSQPALASYSPRQVGDLVLVRNRGGEMLVQDKVGGPGTLGIPVDVLSDSAPVGGGWDAVVTGSLWARAGANGVEWWGKRVTALPPPTGGTVTRTATRYTTYRGGSQTQTDVAEAGDYTGRGLQTGLATFGSGAWSGLSGHTPTGGTLSVHRSAGGHGFSYGQVNFAAYRVLADDPPLSTPSLIAGSYQGSLALNQTTDPPIAVDAAFCLAFANGTASAIGFFSSSARDNIEIDGVTLSISY